MTDNEIRSRSMMLGAHAPCDHRTAAKVLRGEPVLPSVRAAIEAAAAHLGIALPAEAPRAA